MLALAVENDDKAERGESLVAEKSDTEKLNAALAGSVAHPAALESAQEHGITLDVNATPERESATVENQQKTNITAEAAESQYACPRKNGDPMEDEDCFHCPERDGCPAR